MRKMLQNMGNVPAEAAKIILDKQFKIILVSYTHACFLTRSILILNLTANQVVVLLFFRTSVARRETSIFPVDWTDESLEEITAMVGDIVDEGGCARLDMITVTLFQARLWTKTKLDHTLNVHQI